MPLLQYQINNKKPRTYNKIYRHRDLSPCNS